MSNSSRIQELWSKQTSPQVSWYKEPNAFHCHVSEFVCYNFKVDNLVNVEAADYYYKSIPDMNSGDLRSLKDSELYSTLSDPEKKEIDLRIEEDNKKFKEFKQKFGLLTKEEQYAVCLGLAYRLTHRANSASSSNFLIYSRKGIIHGTLDCRDRRT